MTPRVLTGTLDGKGMRVGIVVSRFSDFICDRLLQGALDCLMRHGVADGDILVARVPGALEIPLIARRLARSKRHDAVICIGCVIRGETSHYDQVCSEVARGVAAAGPLADFDKPGYHIVTFTCESCDATTAAENCPLCDAPGPLRDRP